MKAVTSLAVLALATAGTVHAQTWAPVPDTPRGMTAATAEWPSGVIIIARCDRDRRLDVMMTLVQPILQPHVAVSLTMGTEETSEAPSEQRWRLPENGSVVFVRQPGHFSRALINHEPLRLLVMPEEGPRHRYELDPPAGEDVLAEVVTACGHPTTSPIGEDAIITNPDWAARPRGGDLARWYPPEARDRSIDGEATIQCRVSTTGRAEDCITLSESPPGMGFGMATVGASREFRMRPQRVDGQPHGEALVNITINWVMR
jgi:TonB family protein